MLRSWRLAGSVVLAGVILAVVAGVGQGSPGSAAIFLFAFLLVAGLASPLVFPRSVGALRAQEGSRQDGRPIVYWRPGCPYCLKLRRRVGRNASRAYWVNIWTDPAAAAAVRAVTGGDETVPTVVDGAESFVNPDPNWLRDRLRKG